MNNDKITFEQAAEKVKNLTQKPTDEEMLQLYGLYKQATLGDVTTSRPGFWNLVGCAKWDVWSEKKGISQEDAKLQYVALVKQLIHKYEN